MFLSIDLSAQWIRLVQLEAKGDCLYLRGFDRVATPSGSYKNGVPVGMDTLSSAIREAISRNGFTAKKAVLVASSPAIGYQELTLPTTKRGELLTLLAQETRTTSQKETVADYLPLETRVGEGGGQTRLWSVVAPALLVESYRELLVRSGLKPLALDTPANVAARLYEKMGEASTLLMVGVRQEELCLTLLQGRERYCRSVQIQRTNTAPESQFILSARTPLPTEEEGAQVRLSLVEQVSKMVQFQTLRDREHPLGKVLLCSDLAQDPTLSAALREVLEVEVSLPTQPDWLRGAPADFPFEDYCFAVGAGLRAKGPRSGELDLFARLREQKKADGRGSDCRKKWLAGLLLVLLAAGGGCLMLGWQEIRQARAERSQLEAYLSVGERVEAYQHLSQIAGAGQSLEEYNQQVAVYIAALGESRRLGSQEFTLVDAQRPQGVTVASYRYEKGALVVNCTAGSKDSPAQYAANLANSGDFAAVSYSGFDSSRKGGVTTYTFTIRCQLWPAQQEEGK